MSGRDERTCRAYGKFVREEATHQEEGRTTWVYDTNMKVNDGGPCLLLPENPRHKGGRYDGEEISNKKNI